MLVDLAILIADLGNVALAAKMLRRRGIGIHVAKRVLLDAHRRRDTCIQRSMKEKIHHEFYQHQYQ
jgi:hypothetical protein